MEYSHTDGRRNKVWVCLCTCGNITLAAAVDIPTGRVKSCGCLQKSVTSNRSTTHGGSKESLYQTYHGMKARCSNPNNKAYRWYGGKGIKVCKEWDSSYLSFKKWAISTGYRKGLTIDRIDSTMNYEPSNCQWLTRSENTIKSNRGR